MIFNLQWLPEFNFYENKIKIPINSTIAFDFIRQKIFDDEIFQSNETMFWTVLLLYQLDQLSLLDQESVRKYIKDLKFTDGGYKISAEFTHPDIWSTFFCIATLKLLNLDTDIEEIDIEYIVKSQNLDSRGNGGFIHCECEECFISCKSVTSIKTTFLALSALRLVNRLEDINKDQILKYLGIVPMDDLERIFQILSLMLLGEGDVGDLVGKISLKPMPESSETFPSVEYIFWVSLCLGLLEKLESIDFAEMFEFYNTMQQDNGGFMEQHSSISQEPSLLSTLLVYTSVHYIWDKIIDEIENEILFKSSDTLNIYLIPIGYKFSVSEKFIQKIAKIMIDNNWFAGEILENIEIFRNFYEKQNSIPQTIIIEIIKHIDNNPTLKKLDITDFSKRFEFINAKERVRLVINDLLINEFLAGEITQHKKRLILENVLVLKKYIRVSKQIPFLEIIVEKKRKKEAENLFLTIKSELLEYLNKTNDKIKDLVDTERILESKLMVNELIQFVHTKIDRFEELVNQVRDSHQFIKGERFINKFEKMWPVLKTSIEDYLSIVKDSLVEDIELKDKSIIMRKERAEDQAAIRSLEEELVEIDNRLNQFHIELQHFFLLQYTDHKAIINLRKSISDYIEEADNNINSKISEITPKIHFDESKIEINNIKTLWLKKREESEEYLKVYQTKIEKRVEFEHFINEKVAILETFRKNSEIKITNTIEENKFQESSNLLNESIINFNKILSKQNKGLIGFLRRINSEIEDFPQFSNDIRLEWDKKLKEEEEKLNKILTDLRGLLQTRMELGRKDELDQIINNCATDTENLIKNMEKNVSDLIENKNLVYAENMTNEMYAEISQKIKTSDQEFKNYIKVSTTEFKGFKEMVKDLIEKWDVTKKDLNLSLNITKEELDRKRNKTDTAEKNAEIQRRKEELENKAKENYSEIDNEIRTIKKSITDLIEFRNLTEAETKIGEKHTEINQKIKSIDLEIKQDVKTSTTEFKTFRETVKHILEKWELDKKKLILLLDKTKEELENKYDETGAGDKKAELHELIKKEIFELEIKISQFQSNYNQIVKTKDELDDLESTFIVEYADIQEAIKKLDIKIKNLIKTTSRLFLSFDEISEDELNSWNITRDSTEKRLESVYNDLIDDFFIKRVHFFVKAFKEKKIDLAYLSKVMKLKLKPLKLKLITLISNSKLNGELDSDSDTFFLKDEDINGETPKTAQSMDEVDPIKQDIMRLRFLMVIHYGVGASVYSRKLGDWQMDSHLIGGFLSAMQDFNAEIKKKKIPIQSMNYEEFEILLEQGKYGFTALFVDGKGSNWMREKLQAYVKKFEKYFETSLKNWTGELSTFSNSGFLVDEAFELYRV